MERSRREGDETAVPRASRLTVRPRRGNRKRAGSWSGVVASTKGAIDVCGRLVRRALPAAITLALAGGFGAAGYVGYRVVTTSERFAITAIEIRGAHHVDADALRAALPTQLGHNVFLTDLDADRRVALAEPWVASAEVHRTLPHTLVVELVERTAVAAIALDSEHGDGLYLVDGEGHPFKRARVELGETAGLPVVTGLDRALFAASPDHAAALVRDALAALETWKREPARPAIGEITVDAFGALTLHTYDRATAIQLGTLGPELANRIHTFDAAWAELTDDERAHARAVHITSADQVAFADDRSPDRASGRSPH